MLLQFKSSGIDKLATSSLRKMKKLTAKNTGTLQSAVVSAAYYATKRGHTMFVYAGNSFMHQVHRVSDKPSEYLCPIGNTGDRIVSVTPTLEVEWHDKV